MNAAQPAVRRGGRLRLFLVWGVLGLLAVAIGVVQMRDRAADQDEHEAHQSLALMPAPMDQIGVVELFDEGTLHRFERDDKGVWFYHGHVTDPAATAAHTHQADPTWAPLIDKALAGFGRTHTERQLPRGPLEKEYGTVNPEMFILVYAPKELKPMGRIAVGHASPDHMSRYVLPDSSPTVYTIAAYQIDNLRALVKAVTGKMTQAELTTVLSGGPPRGATPAPGDAPATAGASAAPPKF